MLGPSSLSTKVGAEGVCKKQIPTEWPPKAKPRTRKTGSQQNRFAKQMLRPSTLSSKADAEAACKKLLATDRAPWRSLEIANRFPTKPVCKIRAPNKHPFEQGRCRSGLQEAAPDWLAPRAKLRNRKPVPNKSGF